VDPFLHDREQPYFFRGADNFFAVVAGRWREHGWCFGRLGFTWRYTQWLSGKVKEAQRDVIAMEEVTCGCERPMPECEYPAPPCAMERVK
jgi:hypothetical protein